MKKLNKPPERANVCLGKAEGFNDKYDFMFSDELPYMKRRNRKRDARRKQKGRNNG